MEVYLDGVLQSVCSSSNLFFMSVFSSINSSTTLLFSSRKESVQYVGQLMSFFPSVLLSCRFPVQIFIEETVEFPVALCVINSLMNLIWSIPVLFSQHSKSVFHLHLVLDYTLSGNRFSKCFICMCFIFQF